MRAVRFDRYGPPEVLRVEEIATRSPGAGEVSVRVRAASLNPLDWKIRAGHLRFIPVFRGPPRGTGSDFAGEIVGVGGGAMSRHVGERVFGSLQPFPRDGALADFVVVSADRIVPIPDGIDFVQAAALPVAGGTALLALTDKAALAAGQRVLITGAAGGVGHFAVQIAKHQGAHVVGVCSAGNVEFVRALGADEVVDYAKEDFTRRVDRFDVVFDAAGASSFGAARRVLTDAGCYINTCGDAAAAVGTAIEGIVARLTSRRRAIPFVLNNVPATWLRLAALAHDGVLRAYIEREIALEDVAGAHAAMETGHGRGKIVVRIDNPA
jgi:NADPH:quinone reductase-like Zn-dependent oxidoreductase